MKTEQMLTVVVEGHNNKTPLTKGQEPTGGGHNVDNRLSEA